MIKIIITGLCIFSFGVMSLASADFYVTTGSTINLLSSNKIEVIIPGHPKLKLSGTATYSKKSSDRLNITINWQVLEYNHKEQSLNNLISQFSSKTSTIPGETPILVKGNLPFLPKEILVNKDNESSEENEPNTSNLVKSNKNEVSKNNNSQSFPSTTNTDDYSNDNSAEASTNTSSNNSNGSSTDNSSSSGNSNSNSSNTDNNTTPNKPKEIIQITTAIDDCKPFYSQSKGTVDVYVKDYYYDNDGNKVIKKPCYKLKEVPAEYQECTALNDYKELTTYYRKQAIYTDRKDPNDVGQKYAVGPCIPYSSYKIHFDAISSNCPAYIDYSVRMTKGKYYYTTEDGIIHYLTDCIIDPNNTKIPLNIDFKSCPHKDYPSDNYSTYYGRYYYYNNNELVDIGDCRDLGPASHFDYKIQFLRWDHHLAEGYTDAIGKTYIVVNNEAITINPNVVLLHINHNLVMGSWNNYNVFCTTFMDIGCNGQLDIPGYSMREVQQTVTLPQPYGDGNTSILSSHSEKVYYTFEEIENNDKEKTCSAIYKRPDGSESVVFWGAIGECENFVKQHQR